MQNKGYCVLCTGILRTDLKVLSAKSILESSSREQGTTNRDQFETLGELVHI